jgi:hypothetical protein
VEILSKMLCLTCAVRAMAEEIFSAILAADQCIPACRFVAFPHFHSDGYYYGLYPYYKTGYSSLS